MEREEDFWLLGPDGLKEISKEQADALLEENGGATEGNEVQHYISLDGRTIEKEVE